jgi:WD40 repeat protein
MKRVARWGDARLRHAGRLTVIRLLPDGRRLLTAAQDHTARLWDPDSGRELLRFDSPRDSDVWSAAVLPGGDRLLLCDGPRVVLRDATTGEAIREFACDEKQSVFRIQPLTDGCRFVVCCGGGLVQLWDLEAGKVLREFPGFGKSVYAVATTPDDRLLAAGGAEKAIRVWAVGTGDLLHTFQHDKSVYTVMVSPDGRRLASCGDDKTVRMWDLEAGKALWRIDVGSDVKIVSFSPDGARLAAGLKDRLVVLDATEGREVRSIGTPGQTHWPVTFTPDGRFLYSGGPVSVCRWDAATGARVWPPPGARVPETPPAHAAFAPEAGRLLVAEGTTVGIRDVGDGRLTGTDAAPKEIRFLAVSPDGRTAAASCKDQVVCFLDPASGRFQPGREVRFERTPSCVACAAGGDRIVVVCGDRVHVRGPDLQGGDTASFGDEDHDIQDLAVATAGSLAATAGDDGTVRLWNLNDGAEMKRLVVVGKADPKVVQKSPERCALSPDGRSLLVSTENRRVLMWIARDAAGEPASPETVRRWLNDLGADDFRVREEATNSLIAAGERIRPALDAFDARGSAEIAARVRMILQKLAVGHLPVESSGDVTLERDIRDLVLFPDNRRWAAIVGYGALGGIVLGERTDDGLRVIQEIPDGSGPAHVFVSSDGRSLYTVNRDGTVSAYGTPAD